MCSVGVGPGSGLTRGAAAVRCRHRQVAAPTNQCQTTAARGPVARLSRPWPPPATASSRHHAGFAACSTAVVFDTRRALYVWEVPHYPQYYIPWRTWTPRSCSSTRSTTCDCSHGTARRHGLRVGDIERPGGAGSTATTRGTGSPARAVRLGRARRVVRGGRGDLRASAQPVRPCRRAAVAPHVRVELDGVVLAESAAPVLVFETGLPTRYYVDRTDVRWEHLVPSDDRTVVPVQGDHVGLLVGRARRRVAATSPGPTGSRPTRCVPSPAWSRSTTRRWTSSSTASPAAAADHPTSAEGRTVRSPAPAATYGAWPRWSRTMTGARLLDASPW